MSKVKQIIASEVLQSGSIPTISAKLVLDDNRFVETTVASDDENFPYQSHELRDGDEKRYDGKGVLRSINFINNLLAPKLVGISPLKLIEVDDWLTKADSTANKSRLGVNTLSAISTLFAKAGALESNIPLYVYLNNLFNKRYPGSIVTINGLPSPAVTVFKGGEKGNANFDFKEFMIIAPSSFTFSKALEMSNKIASSLKRMFKKGTLMTNTEGLNAIVQAIDESRLKLAIDLFIGLDFGAYFFEKGGSYSLRDKPQPLKNADYISFLDYISKKFFPLLLIDPITPEDWQTWKSLNDSLSKESYLVASDVIASNRERMKKAISEKICSSFMIRPHMVGTVTEIFDMVAQAKINSLSYIFSSSDRETNDSFIADLSVALQPDFVKFGFPRHGENFAKYNRMLEIEREMSKK